jgi:hypothetical protein
MLALIPVSAGALRAHVAGQFDSPAAIATHGSNIWVANQTSNSVVAFNMTTGTNVFTITGKSTGIVAPKAIIAAGANIFVASSPATVTQIDATTGAVLHVLRAKGLHFTGASAFYYRAPDLWVVDSGANALTEINVTHDSLVRLVSQTSTHKAAFKDPMAIAGGNGDLWVVNDGNNSVTEVNAMTGAVLRILSASAFQFTVPGGVAFSQNLVWVTEPSTDEVTVINAANGTLNQVITNSSHSQGYGFNAPGPVLGTATNVYVASPPGGSPMVTQLEPSTGVANWMMCNTNYAFNFSNPDGLAIDGANLFVANQANNTVTEMNAATGVLVQDFS